MSTVEILLSLVAALYGLVIGLGAYAYAQDRRRQSDSVAVLFQRIDENRSRIDTHSTDFARQDERQKAMLATLDEHRDHVGEALERLRGTIEQLSAKMDRLLTRIYTSESTR